MAIEKTLTRKKLLSLLEKDPSGLEGLEESQWLDFKSEPHLKPNNKTEDKHRFEIAKDVTAMANAGGGLIVWGYAEEHLEREATKKVGKMSPVAEGVVDPAQVHQTIDQWVHPSSRLNYSLERCPINDGLVWVLDIRGQEPENSRPSS